MDALAALYARWADRVVGYAWRMLGRREDAEDVCTEVFCRLMDGRLQADRSVRSALFTAVHRACIDRARRARRRGALLLLFTAPAAEPASPEDHALGDERARVVRQALGELPPDQRSVLLLFYLEGMTAEEVGPIVGLTPRQVWSRLGYARRLLQAELTTRGGWP